MAGGTIKRTCQEPGESSKVIKMQRTGQEPSGSSDSKWSSNQYLPSEILDKILSQLDVRSMKAASNVCEYWKLVLNENQRFLWFHGKELIEKDSVRLKQGEEGKVLFVGHQLVLMNFFYKFLIIDYKLGQTWNIIDKIDRKEAVPVDVEGKASDSLIAIEYIFKSDSRKFDRILKVWSRSRISQRNPITTIEIGKDESLRQYEMHQSTIFLVKGDGDLSALVVKQDGTVDNFKLTNPNIRHICDLRYPYALVTTAPEMEYIAVKFNLSEKKVEKMAMMNKRKIFKEILDYDGVGHDSYYPCIGGIHRSKNKKLMCKETGGVQFLPPSYVFMIEYDDYDDEEIRTQIWSLRMSDFSGQTIFKIEHRYDAYDDISTWMPHNDPDVIRDLTPKDCGKERHQKFVIQERKYFGHIRPRIHSGNF